VKSLTEELQQKKIEEDKQNLSEKNVNPTVLKEELSVLQNQLASLLQEDQYSPFLNPRYEVEHSTSLQQNLSKKLFSELSVYTKSNKSSEGGKDLKSSVTYELYFAPDKAKYMQMSKFADLERRLAELEKIVGLTVVSSFPLPSSLISMVEELKSDVSLLNTNQLDSILRKLQTVSQEMNDVLAKNETLPPTSSNDQVNELFEMMKKWDTKSQQLESVVGRLNSLRVLHEQSGSFVHTVKQLESEQDEIKNLLKTNNDLTTQLETNFTNNMTAIQSNITALEKRFTSLSKKMEELGMETY